MMHPAFVEGYREYSIASLSESEIAKAQVSGLYATDAIIRCDELECLVRFDPMGFVGPDSDLRRQVAWDALYPAWVEWLTSPERMTAAGPLLSA